MSAAAAGSRTTARSNHGQLRGELRSAAAPFRSASDTEVILRGYDRWGDEVMTRLRGMFAFALFDAAPAHPRLVLARDRSGSSRCITTATGSASSGPPRCARGAR